jgi:hypothetical protein
MSFGQEAEIREGGWVYWGSGLGIGREFRLGRIVFWLESLGVFCLGYVGWDLPMEIRTSKTWVYRVLYHRQDVLTRIPFYSQCLFSPQFLTLHSTSFCPTIFYRYRGEKSNLPLILSKRDNSIPRTFGQLPPTSILPNSPPSTNDRDKSSTCTMVQRLP